MKHSAFSTAVILDVQQDCIPEDVTNEVRRMWSNFYYGNDVCYHTWSDSDAPEFPALAKFLEDSGVTDCLIHWWW